MPRLVVLWEDEILSDSNIHPCFRLWLTRYLPIKQTHGFVVTTTFKKKIEDSFNHVGREHSS